MEGFKNLPELSNCLGYLWTVATLKDVCIIEYDLEMQIDFEISKMIQVNRELVSNKFVVKSDDESSNVDAYMNLRSKIIELDKKQIYKTMVIIPNNKISRLELQDAIDQIIFKHDIKSQIIVSLIEENENEYKAGIEQAFMDLTSNIVQKPVEQKETYNIIGFRIDQYKHESDLKEIHTLMQECFDKECQCDFALENSIEPFKYAAQASVNIVVSKEALLAAQYLEKEYNIPYIETNPLGMRATMNLIESLVAKLKWRPNRKYISKYRQKCKTALMKTHLVLQQKNLGRAVVVGDGEKLESYRKLLIEIGFTEIHTIDKYKDEDEKHYWLRDKRPDYLFSDAETARNYNQRKWIQIENPNIEKDKIENMKPLMGFNGVIAISEQLIKLSGW